MIGTAIEEIVRCATPVIPFRRTATVDAELAGVRIVKGDTLVKFYESANREETVFSDPDRFDILRNPNPHVGFGGGGRTSVSGPTWLVPSFGRFSPAWQRRPAHVSQRHA